MIPYTLKQTLIVISVSVGCVASVFSANTQMSFYSLPKSANSSFLEDSTFKDSLLDAVKQDLENLMGVKESDSGGVQIIIDTKQSMVIIVGDKESIRKTDEYMESLRKAPIFHSSDKDDSTGPAESYSEVSPTVRAPMLSRIYTIHHADPRNIRNILNQIIQESRSRYSKPAYSIPSSESPVQKSIFTGFGKGIQVYDLSIDAVSIEKSPAGTLQAKLYAYRPGKDWEFTLQEGRSTRFDQYLISVNKIDVDRKQITITVSKR